MSNGQTETLSRASFATLVWTVPVRVVDVSRSGCRLESPRWMRPGMSGQLTLSLQGNSHEDDIRIARCQPRQGAGHNYVLGAELLRTRRLNGRSIRLAIGRLIGEQEMAEHPPPGNGHRDLPDLASEQEAKGVSRGPPVPVDTET